MTQKQKEDLIEEYGKDHLIDTNNYDEWGNIIEE